MQFPISFTHFVPGHYQVRTVSEILPPDIIRFYYILKELLVKFRPWTSSGSIILKELLVKSRPRTSSGSILKELLDVFRPWTSSGSILKELLDIFRPRTSSGSILKEPSSRNYF